jgi:calcineurin-like phosphoesterase family protein
MSKTFLISDTHFGHQGVCNFLRDDNTKLRPWDNYESMDEDLVKNWNSVVSASDRVYHLGDVVINRRALKTLGRLNGRKVLIKGNHDIFKLHDYVEYFDDIRAYHVLEDCVLSHVPVHPDTLYRWNCNIHGHLHHRRVVDDDGKTIDPRYYNVSVECIDYVPIEWNDLKKKIQEQQNAVQ